MLCDLPVELLLEIAEYLASRDIIMLACSDKTTQQALLVQSGSARFFAQQLARQCADTHGDYITELIDQSEDEAALRVAVKRAFEWAAPALVSKILPDFTAELQMACNASPAKLLVKVLVDNMGDDRAAVIQLMQHPDVQRALALLPEPVVPGVLDVIYRNTYSNYMQILAALLAQKADIVDTIMALS